MIVVIQSVPIFWRSKMSVLTPFGTWIWCPSTLCHKSWRFVEEVAGEGGALHKKLNDMQDDMGMALGRWGSS